MFVSLIINPIIKMLSGLQIFVTFNNRPIIKILLKVTNICNF